MIFSVELIISNCAGQGSLDAGAQLKTFAAAKEQQAQSLAASIDVDLPPEFQSFFSAVRNDDWESISNNYFEIKRLISANSAYHRNWWQPVVETYGAEEQLRGGDEKYFTLYADDIIQSIPPGSIYFGGTDPGRFIITAMQKSQINGDPFFTLTQNALADGTYLDYLRSIYGDQIYLPTARDSQKCFDDYYTDVRKRMANGQLEPGEEVTNDPVTGKMQVSGQVAVMQLNGLLVKMIFDKEPARDFYVEESFPLKWMYPYLEPHGLIFKLNHEPLAGLPDEMVQRNHDFWVKTVSPMIGDWLKDDTSVSDVAAFVEKVFVQFDLTGFTGDPNFIKGNSHRNFSKERSSSAGLYAWHAQNAVDPAEKQRMSREADFGFRQAWALCPDSPEVIFRYVQFLMSVNRLDDAMIVAQTGLEVDPQNVQVLGLLRNLENYKKHSGSMPQTQNQSEAFMEDEARANPTNYMNIFSLAGYYLRMQETNRASELLLQTVSQPDVPVAALRAAAQLFAQTGDFPALETTLKKTAAVAPSPEAWYDLARVEAHLGENDAVIPSLQTAINLSDLRLQTNSEALNIRNVVRQNTTDFDPTLRSSPDFEKLISP